MLKIIIAVLLMMVGQAWAGPTNGRISGNFTNCSMYNKGVLEPDYSAGCEKLDHDIIEAAQGNDVSYDAIMHLSGEWMNGSSDRNQRFGESILLKLQMAQQRALLKAHTKFK